jgi:hypothetical protein
VYDTRSHLLAAGAGAIVAITVAESRQYHVYRPPLLMNPLPLRGAGCEKPALPSRAT